MTFSVSGGLLEPEHGNMIQIDSHRWFDWLAENQSFRYESNEHAPYTARKERADYWYGYRKVSGKLHKRYIGKTVEVTQDKLEAIGEALNVAPETKIPKVTQVVTDTVTQVVTDTVTDNRLAALELQVQALQQFLETLRGELPGKSDAGNSPELPIVTDSELQTRLGNLESENAELRRQLDNSDHLLLTLKETERKLRSDLATAKQEASEWEEENSDLLKRGREHREEIERLTLELASRSQNSPAIELPEPPDPIEVTNKLNALLTRKNPQLAVKDVRKILNG